MQSSLLSKAPLVPQFILTLSPSWVMELVLVTLYIATIICLVQLSLAWSLKWLLAGLIIIQFLVVSSIHALLQSAHSVVQIQFCAERYCLLINPFGEIIEAWLLDSTFISPWLIVLNFSTSKLFNSSVLVMPDSIAKGQWRRLRAYLLLSK